MNTTSGWMREAAVAESPMLLPTKGFPLPVTVWVGAFPKERPVFWNQARWLAEPGLRRMFIDEGLHHSMG